MKTKKKKKYKKKNTSKKYNDYVDKYNKSKNIFKTVKTSFKSILKDKVDYKKLQLTILNVNNIITHTYQFLKLYCLHIFDSTNKLPEINEVLINLIMKTLCIREGSSNSGKKPSSDKIKLMETLNDFYENSYKKTLNKALELTYTNLNTVLDYETISVFTCINNHIKEHFVTFLNRYINVMVNKFNNENFIRDNIKEKALRKFSLKMYRKALYSVKNDILEDTDKCFSEYNWLKTKIRNMLPKKVKDTIYKDIDNNPLSYLECMIKMSREIELKGPKTFSCFPLRNYGKPKYIKLDTTTLVHLLFSDLGIKKAHYLTNGNTKLLQDDIWQIIFNTKHKVFKDKKYSFNHSILTDGVGCSILFIRNDKYDPLKVVKIKPLSKPFNYREFKYIDELTDNEKESIKNQKLIGIDPGKIRLISATDGVDNGTDNKHNIKLFTYSHSQRKYESKIDKYKYILENLRKETKINNLSVEQIESSLSKYSSKTCIYNNCINYFTEKNKVNDIVHEFYEKEIFRKLNWNGYINKRRSEDCMINRFREVFGDPKDVSILYGDFSENRPMKNCEPTKGKSIRQLFKRKGYNLYLVNEYNTSKKSFIDGSNLETFLKRKDNKTNNIRKVHGLLRSETVPNNKLCKCVLLNRDLNGSMNILKKGNCILNDLPIPKYLCR